MSKFGKYFLLTTGFLLLATFGRITRPITNVHAQSGCSVASLKGTYAYHISGVNAALGGPTAEMGLDVFNGDGKRGAIRATGSSVDGNYDWSDGSWPNGSYTVDPDCTGSFFTASGTKTGNIIVLEGGKRFSLISYDPEPGRVLTGEGARLQEEKD